MEFYALLTFVLITSITPGPNNISSLSFSVSLGYRGTLKYILGIVSGTFIILLLCASLSRVLILYVPEFEDVLSYFAAAYICYLAYRTLKLSATDIAKADKSASFINGAVLQLVNPKAIMYGITIYSSFLSFLASNYLLLMVSAFLLSIVTFICVSIWALFGDIIQKYLKNKLFLRIISISLSLLLVLFAIKILGLFD